MTPSPPEAGALCPLCKGACVGICSLNGVCPVSGGQNADGGPPCGSDFEASRREGSEPEGSNKYTRRQNLTMVSLAISDFCASLAFSIIAPFFPQEASKKGASDTEIGLIFGAFELTIVFLAPVYGMGIGRIGPKFMYLAGCFICSTCLILFGFLDKCPDGQVYVAMCFVCRIVEANGLAMLATASFAITAHQFPSQMSTALGFLEAFSGLGMMDGPPVGGALFSAGGFRLPFIVVGCALIASTFASYFLLPTIDSARGAGSLLALLKIPKLVLIFFIICSATFAMSFIDPTLSKHIAKVDPALSPAEIGAVFLVSCGSYTLTIPLFGYISDKGFLMRLVFPGCLFLATGYILLGPSPLLSALFPEGQRLWLVCVSLVLEGLGVGATLMPTFQLSLHSMIKAGYSESLETHGLISGLFNCAFSLGAFAGPSAAGAISDRYGFEWAATGCAFVLLAMAVVVGCVGVITRERTLNTYLPPAPTTNQQSTACNESTPLLAATETGDGCAA